jgi:tetratricopeptide (TPR) repeat protein
MKYLISLVCLSSVIFSHAQNDWKWPVEEAMFKMAQEKQAYYKVLMGQDKYQEALSVLKWLYVNNAELNPSIYIDGTKCAEEAMKGTTNAARVDQLQDTALWMYDMRIKYWGNEASVLDRKAYTAFKYFYKTPKKYPELIVMFDKTFSANGSGISTFNILPYMTTAKYGYEWTLKEMPGDKVLEIHSMLSNILDDKEKMGEEMTDIRNKVDALLSSIDGLLSCDYIEQNLVPRLKANPSDIGTAKKIFAYSLQAKCSDKDYFLQAAEIIVMENPDFKLLKILGDKWLSSGDLSKASEFYGKALPLAQTNQDKYELNISLAKVASKQGQLSKARGFANEALSVNPGEKEPYNLIGNLYFNSFNECAGKEDIVKDRAVYIAAYNMYQKAGNSSLMKAAEAQFPSSEEIFTKNYNEGDQITVGCWINEKVIIKKRPN